MSRSRRKLSMWGALPPYLGGKRRLCPIIFREIDRVLPRRLWAGRTFLDGFLGGGSVSLYAKTQGFRVVACDIAQRSTTVGEALIANSRVTLTREDILRILAPSVDPPGVIETKYVPRVFTQTQGRFLDRALKISSETPDPAKAALIRLLAVRVMLLAHPLGKVRSGTIHRLETGDFESITESCLQQYVSGMRLTQFGNLWELAQQINAGVFQGEGQVLHADLLEVLPAIWAHLFYADPPYPGTLGYEAHYKVVDEILEGTSRPASPFTAKTGAGMVDVLLEKAGHIPIWVLSLGNAVIGLEELEAKMARLGRETRAVALKYEHLAALATDEKREGDREFLVVGWNPRVVFPRKYSDRAFQVVETVADAVVPLQMNTDLVGSERPTPLSLTGDALPQCHSSEPEELAPGSRGAVTEFESGVDQPDPLLVEARSDRRGERGDVASGVGGIHTVTDLRADTRSTGHQVVHANECHKNRDRGEDLDGERQPIVLGPSDHLERTSNDVETDHEPDGRNHLSTSFKN
jgi:adenine-specific DNA-methyltransferase